VGEPAVGDTVWNDLQRFLDYLLREYGISRVLLAPFATIAILVGAGLVTGRTSAFVATGISLFIAVVFISALSLELKATRQLLGQRARVLNRYTDRFSRSIESNAFVIEDWDEKVVVSRHGDTVLERWVTIEVGDEELYSVWSAIYMHGEVTASDPRRVKVESRGFDENGNPGARHDITKKWDGNRLQLFIHFEQPAQAHQTVRLWIRWEWPRYYKDLLDGDTAVVEWMMHRPTKRVATKITFDPSCKLSDNLRITPYQGAVTPRQARTPDKGTEIAVEYLSVTTGMRFGFTLDGRRLRE
jgi:hypothetical protein